MSYRAAFFRATLLGHDTIDYLNGRKWPDGLTPSDITLAFTDDQAIIIDDHEQEGGIGTNTQGEQTIQIDFDAEGYKLFSTEPSTDPFFGEDWREIITGKINGSFFGGTTAMIVKGGTTQGIFRSPLGNRPGISPPTKVWDLTGTEIWIRAAEVYISPFEGSLFNNTGSPPIDFIGVATVDAIGTSFDLGLRNQSGS